VEDALVKFLFEKSNVRGRIVRLDGVWRAIRSRYDYPQVAAQLLGEATAACALLMSTVKLDGSVTLQLQSEGDLAITLEPDQGKQRYQGIVELAGDTFATALTEYFERSEQLPTRLWLSADSERATGLLLQRVPGEEGDDEDLWERAVALAETVQSDELLQLSSDEILHRLFHEEDVRVFEPELYSFRCRCSRDMIRNVISQLGFDEAHKMVSEDGEIRAECEFCTQTYAFDAVDVEEIFAAADQPDVPTTRH
jgi:molecular chaperone Hsp33